MAAARVHFLIVFSEQRSTPGECRWDIDGKSNADNSVLSEKFAYILERCPFPKEYTPREIEKCFADFYEAFDRKKYYEILSRYNIPLNKQLFKLSRGNIIVVQIAFAFSYKSEVLFLDEPSAHLDSYARNELYKCLLVSMRMKDILLFGRAI